MDILEVGRRVFIVLSNANSRNKGKEIYVSIDELVRELQLGSTVEISREQIVNAIKNDPFRQVNAYGWITNTPLFETISVNEELKHVRLPQLAYDNPRPWGLY